MDGPEVVAKLMSKFETSATTHLLSFGNFARSETEAFHFGQAVCKCNLGLTLRIPLDWEGV